MSVSRKCFIGKAIDEKWYMQLGNFEHAYYKEDCTFYGPFNSQEEAEEELKNHSNPGSIRVDDSGTLDVPPNPVNTSTLKKHWH